MEQALIILIFLAISFFNWLAQRAQEKQAQQEDAAQRNLRRSERRQEGGSAPVSPDAAPDSEEERLRRFFEALGLPVENERPQAAPPPPPPPPPVVVTPPPPAPALQQRAEPARAAKTPDPSETLSAAERAALQRLKSQPHTQRGLGAEVGSTHARKTLAGRRGPTPSIFSEALALLEDPTAARKAIILREVLGEPVGLRKPANEPIF
ncbi:MAG: hypothetical protein SNJ52_00060 [Verrucomicrobiia bacterium]